MIRFPAQGTNISYTIASSKIGDVCINATSWDVYSCVGTNLWDYKGNIKGAKGDPGDKGDPIWIFDYTEETTMEDSDYVVVFKNGQPARNSMGKFKKSYKLWNTILNQIFNC